MPTTPEGVANNYLPPSSRDLGCPPNPELLRNLWRLSPQIRRAQATRVRDVVRAAAEDRGLPYVWVGQPDHAFLKYSSTNDLHVDIWFADIALSEHIDDRVVKAALELGHVRFDAKSGPTWRRARSTRLKTANIETLHLLNKYMVFPHHHQSQDSLSTNVIVFREPGHVELTIVCHGEESHSFYVAIGENHVALPDPLEFKAVTNTNHQGGNFQGWMFKRCNSTTSHDVAFDVAPGTEIQIAIRTLLKPTFSITWAGEVRVVFSPDVNMLRLQAARVHFAGNQWDYGSKLQDGAMPADWYFPVRECSYGMLTINCPNQPHPVLAMTFSGDFMTPSLCHACMKNVAVETTWKEMAKAQHLSRSGVGIVGAAISGVGVKVQAYWCAASHMHKLYALSAPWITISIEIF